MQRVFILSPARTTGKRAALLYNEGASFDLACRLRQEGGVAIGDVFAFLSGLYFRGKLAYARRFAVPPAECAGGYVITSDMGLVACEHRIILARLRQFSRTMIDPAEPNYRRPLERTAGDLAALLPSEAEVVLLGSIATDKYIAILREQFGDRLAFPREFIGRGDMSRGGLLLRAAAAGTELEYVAIHAAASRTGARPPKLLPIKRRAARPAEQ
ncbi:MAG: hypothetical protein IT424_12045 [Pirellulales bacterium]|nr:hypothetical protein [Pirellulales bacterium]